MACMNLTRQIGQRRVPDAMIGAQVSQSTQWPQRSDIAVGFASKHTQHVWHSKSKSSAGLSAATAEGPRWCARRSRASAACRRWAIELLSRRRAALHWMPSNMSLHLPSTAPWTSQIKAFLPQRVSKFSNASSSSAFFCVAVRVTSTKGTKTTGARKRSPTRRPGRAPPGTAAATEACSRARGIESVLVARSAPSLAPQSASANTLDLTFRLSGTASTMMSALRTASAIVGHQRATRGPSPSYGTQAPPRAGASMPASLSRPCRLHSCKTSATALSTAA
mmetsp:Transcript_7521/g.21158  ORF Transcript_7521/g.21158 Transcript_7521/m.21158 type:complete len:279 (+) Transcript_7521:127-963(+)